MPPGVCRTRSIGTFARRFLDGGNDGLRILQIDMPGAGEAEQAPLLLAMDHGDHARAVRLLDGTDGLSTLDRIPTPHEQRLQRHDDEKQEQQRREIE